jgi:uncharacterized membrane protein
VPAGPPLRTSPLAPYHPPIVESDYNVVAGSDLGRLSALSDGIFAVAMTLLVLDLRVPAQHLAHSAQPLWTHGALHAEGLFRHVLAHQAPRLLAYFMSFLTLGIFWLAQQAQMNRVARGDRRFAWINIAFLACVALMPFSTALLAEFITFRLALAVYWLNLLLLGAMLYASLSYAARAGLLRREVTADVLLGHRRRIGAYQALYAVCALLSVLSTYVSIALIIALQLNSVIGLRHRRRPFSWL